METKTMDAMSKTLSINVAQRLIHKLISESDIDTIEKFWLVELNNLHLSESDSNILERILSLQSENTEVSQTLYKNCINGDVVSTLLKKNWRRFFNNNIIEKYHNYYKEQQFSADKIWKMGNHEITNLECENLKSDKSIGNNSIDLA